MSIHKLTAGSGYDYLTRQVAAMDSTEKGRTGLASYYTERGETPGVWVGSGLAGFVGLGVGDVVTAEQMQALFGQGLHPLAAELRARLQSPDLTEADYEAIGRLGAPFKVYANDVSPFRVEVAKRLVGLNQAAGLPGDWPVPAAERAEVRSAVAQEFFVAEFGREPRDARELAATIAKHSRPKTQAVAGFDLTFSPVKSVSALWAVADPATAAAIERAHRAAVQDALSFIESHALFSRTGTNGVRQVDVHGLVAAAFTHRDSRAEDPDLHTHVAVANKVETLDGRWLSVDGRVLFKATVAASETYNTALEGHLKDRLGVRFEERPQPDPRLRPVREIVGVEPALNARWSARRADIDTRRGQLAAQFQHDHGRPPTPVETLHLAQQATLETRQAKHEPRTLTEQRTTWAAEAADVLGGSAGVKAMIRKALTRSAPAAPVTDADWVSRTGRSVVTAMEGRRSTWQVWHVRAEAYRRVRSANVPTGSVEGLVDRVVADVLHARSVSLARPDDGVTEPPALRRVDGASVYSVAGADLFTSATVLTAEQRLVAAAGRTDGYVVDGKVVDLALLASTANGVTLNAGQAALVRAMATSGARLQLAIAPAGAGKTTALQALTAAWTDGGGNVIGLAPSAAAAAQLGDHINTDKTHANSARADNGAAVVVTDTLAKLTWALEHGDPPGWVRGIGPTTLVLVDEAGMADTLSLDTVVRFVTGRGGSVRLIGDDQQLAAIGAGGVLRDIQATHGAVRLTDLLRFTDPAEANASLALRDGRLEALGFYLDQARVHVGDLATITEDVFAGWQTDRDRGLDSIMLAPTRDLVAQLNQRARTHRLTTTPPSQSSTGTAGPTKTVGPAGAVEAGGTPGGGAAVRLADDNRASVGDLVITRANDRLLRVSATDWVKNGDRWLVLDTFDGALQVQHTQSGRIVRLPAEYVRASTELGYATTVHTAQGVTADTMHGLAGGEESRQQLYTMMTRGRAGNHVYLQVVGDGDPHTVIKPEMVHPSTPTDLLEQILACDDSPRSATTLQRDQHDPTVRLGDAAPRYVDALYLAAEHVVGPDTLAALEAAADRLVSGLTLEPAWPTLRAHLLLIAAAGTDPVAALTGAAAERELGSADDKAAVLDWRLDSTGLRNTGRGPLPWLPGIPTQLRTHPVWGEYLTGRAQLITKLANTVREQVHDREVPDWTNRGGQAVPPGILEDVTVWRAAMQVPDTDRRPTGPKQLAKAARNWQKRLDQALAGTHTPAWQEWQPVLTHIAAHIRDDQFAPVLAERLAGIARAGLDARTLLHTEANTGALPDDHPAAALWWRISRHLTPPVAGHIDHGHPLTTPWIPHLAPLLGVDTNEHVQGSTWWPALVTVVDDALQRGWQLDNLIKPTPSPDHSSHQSADELCQQLVWRISLLSDPVPTDDHFEAFHDTAPADLWTGVEPDRRREVLYLPQEPVGRTTADPVSSTDDVERWVEPDLAVAALIRASAGLPEPNDDDVHRMLARDAAWQSCPVSRGRMLTVNQLTWDFFRDQYPSSWGETYTAERFGQSVTAEFQPGQAPAGWTTLVAHLRRQGVTDLEMTTTGVATVASTGRLIDRFRDRVVFPIVHQGHILGFVGRRHPDRTDNDHSGPKYLNTPDTPLFHKGAQLFCATEHNLAGGSIPVVVEGPMDAIAVTIATAGRHVGVAPLGTSLTDEQAAQLGRNGINPIVATDGDLAGRIAAERAYWMLTPYRLDPAYAHLPPGTDPADLLTHHGAEALTSAISTANPLAGSLIHERITNLPPDAAQHEAGRVIAARPPTEWDQDTDRLAAQLNVTESAIRQQLHEHVKTWNTDPRAAAQTPLHQLKAVKDRMATSSTESSNRRSSALGADLDPQRLGGTDALKRASRPQVLPDHDLEDRNGKGSAISHPGQPPTRDPVDPVGDSVTTAADNSPTRPTRTPGSNPAKGRRRHDNSPTTTFRDVRR